MENGHGVFAKIPLGLDSNRTNFDDMQGVLSQRKTTQKHVVNRSDEKTRKTLH
jgi:hypothetical protein